MRDELESKARAFLDTLSQTYIDYTIESQINLNKNTLDYIDRQLSGVTGILDSIETNLETYKEQQDILDLSREQTQFFDKLLNFESEKRQINMKLESLESLENYLISSKENSKILPPALYITEDDFLQGSLRDLYNLEVQKSQEIQNLIKKFESFLLKSCYPLSKKSHRDLTSVPCFSGFALFAILLKAFERTYELKSKNTRTGKKGKALYRKDYQKPGDHRPKKAF